MLGAVPDGSAAFARSAFAVHDYFKETSMHISHFALGIWVGLVASTGVASAAQVTITRGQKAQTIDGFGFFGAHDVWWGKPADMVNADWVDAVFDDLGITIWRNEIHPPADSIAAQDADWPKQKPVVQAMAAKAKATGVPLKVILSVWSPPSSMKCAVGTNGVVDGSPHSGGTKNGGGLCPSKRSDFANYLIAALKQYSDIGVDVYALSFQNEPLFVEPYNSCVYTQKEYADTLAAIGPIVHAAYPNLKFFGSENMLGIEAGGANGFDPYWYTANFMKSEAALAQLGIVAVHGYSDGVLATPASKMSKLWASFLAGTASTRLPIWMTETSGYLDTIEGNGTLPGALDLAQSIYAALYHGHLAAWVWWQGSELGNSAPGEFGLMSSTTKRGKKYYVSKQFYRYIRPGAQMVQAASDDPEVLVAAFEHPITSAFTVIAINAGTTGKTATISGAGVPAEFQAYRTSTSENCANLGTVTPATLALPARSITTLVNGKVVESPTGAGGVPADGGARATGGTLATSSGGTMAAGGGVAMGGVAAEGGFPGLGGDATGGTASTSKGSGCGCTVGGSPRIGQIWALAVFLTVGFILRRRR
jgi:O-glycosyl hydrolase